MTTTVISPTIWQDNAAFSERQPDAIDQERRAAVRAAVELILDRQAGRALYLLVRSVERQNRIASGGTVDIHPGCPCGGRCDRGATHATC